MDSRAPDGAFRRAVLAVAILNLAYFVVEFVIGRLIGSVSLFADSVDFLEDTSINLLIFFAAVWSARARRTVGRILAFVILVPAAAAIVAAVLKILDPARPDVASLSFTALGAMVVNVGCAFVLARHRAHPSGLAKAAWLSARNDALANVAMVLAALVSIPLASGWPDIVVGVGIGVLNLDAAREVWQAASRDAADAASAEA